MDDCFLFCARVCRNFRRAYIEQKGGKTSTSFQCVLEETESGAASNRLNDVIAGLEADKRRRGVKEPLQSLSAMGNSEKDEAGMARPSSRIPREFQIPATSLVVLLLAKALQTPHALFFAKRVAEFFHVPPVSLLIAHLTEMGQDSLPSLVKTLSRFGLSDDFRELEGMFDSLGLNLEDLVPGPRFVLRLASFVREGDVAGLRSCLQEHMQSMTQRARRSLISCSDVATTKEVVELHESLCRKSRERGVDPLLMKEMEDAVVSACVESGKFKEPAVWYVLTRRLSWSQEEGGSALRMLKAYVSRLSDLEIKLRGLWTGGLSDEWFLDVLVCLCGDLMYLSSFKEGGCPVRGLYESDVLGGVLRKFALMWKEWTQEGSLTEDLKRSLEFVDNSDLRFKRCAIRDAMDAVCFVLLNGGSVELLREFIALVGVKDFFLMLQMTTQVCAYWTKQQIGTFRYLCELRPEWTFAVGDRRGWVILREWEEVEFLVFECGLPWASVLEKTILPGSLHSEALQAGAPAELLHVPEVGVSLPIFRVELSYGARFRNDDADAMVADILGLQKIRQKEGRWRACPTERGVEALPKGAVNLYLESLWETGTLPFYHLEPDSVYANFRSALFSVADQREKGGASRSRSGGGRKAAQRKRGENESLSILPIPVFRLRASWLWPHHRCSSNTTETSLCDKPQYVPSMTALALGQAYAWRRIVGNLTTVALLHRCSCFTVMGESTDCLKRVSGIGPGPTHGLDGVPSRAATQALGTFAWNVRQSLPLEKARPFISRLVLDGVVRLLES
uniref:Uncharacterized protein n=1 Tax=Chromera velia CCMP2878 TaxID=1169474 RepID=A0A0G4I4K4_9ALVE|eukprot:Cvel_1805.t1-p1 / transcript=Cvel_1805.t1 / gene=Cvel_1805 / organism=Chromera_velia_CCMP2878 / gene_product=hypothetical protein / transcript_product=hypothetical protein / location=Cvel_scaffold66:94761-97130(-) / protein_length=790 / sequence_SO=supercontig / SO=protein_coding / is_pseudo=false